MEWRMGSNAPTTLSSDIDLKFGDKTVSKGKYVLKAKLIEAGKWHLMIYKEKDLVAEVPLTLGKNSQPVELVTIKLEKTETPMELEKNPKNSQKLTLKGWKRRPRRKIHIGVGDFESFHHVPKRLRIEPPNRKQVD